MAKIVVMFKGTSIKEVAIGKDGIKVGRDPDNEIQIDNPAVSRHHAEIYRQDYAFYIEDMKSTNGTLLNGAHLNWKRALKHNDKINIGKHTLVFVEETKDFPDKTPKRVGSETLCLTPEDLERMRRNS